MNPPRSESEPRILIVDDNPSIHDDFRKILAARSESHSHLDNIEAELFGEPSEQLQRTGFRIDSAHQGQEALEMVQQALKEGDPYVLAFVDFRIPPGWDGIETLERIWQCSPELQAVICTAYSDYSWDDMTRRLGQTDNLLILKKPFETVEVLQLSHAMTQKWILARQAKLRMEDLDRMVRQRTEELRASEERFSKAFHFSPNPAVILSCADRMFLDANQTFLELTGYTGEELCRHSDQELQLWIKGAEADAGSFLPEGKLRSLPCQLRRSDGTIRQIILSSEPVNLGPTDCLLLAAEDVTDHAKLEAQLRQAQKMEVIGRMAAGIAHEFNNVLTVIQGNTGLLQTAGASMLDRNALLNQIMQASQRAATFTKQLLAFSRKQVLQTRLLNLTLVVQNTRKMLSRLLGEKYEIQLNCAAELPSVMADDCGIEQVLINLALNARDAMPKGGIIQITTETCVVSEDVTNPEARPGRFVRLTVADNGCGMDPQVIARIFDPFFTTKEIGKGTGLGLSTIHGIVKQHEGWIDVSSEPGRGSRFEIYLPACNAPAAKSMVMDQQSLPEPGRGETILVVEDEIAVRELAASALSKRGYQVLKASNGPEAITLWDQCTTPIDLLLTDMVMPCGMSGGELGKALLNKNPKLKILYTSGYSPEILRKDSFYTQGINFLPKPYDFPTLLKAVRTCLEGGHLPRHEAKHRRSEPAAMQ
ncbi:MAG TPA: response regulator [Candidatus Paceibacterota bacterium]|nr:response regulator [Candidatus Paceibacterota bacterium]